RLRLDRRQPLLGWLEAWQQEQAERSEAIHLPLVEIQRLVGLPREQSLFDSLVVFENVPVDRRLEQVEDVGLTLHSVDYRPQTHYPLTLLIVPERQLTLRLLHRIEEYGPSSARLLLNAMEEVLERMSRHPWAELATLVDGLGLDRDGLEETLAAVPGVVRAWLQPPSWESHRWRLHVELEPAAEGSNEDEMVRRLAAAVPAELAGEVDWLWIAREHDGRAAASPGGAPETPKEADQEAESEAAAPALAVLELPADRPPDAESDVSAKVPGEVGRALPAPLVAAAVERARAAGISLEMLLAAGVAVLLGRLATSRRPAFSVVEMLAERPAGPWLRRWLSLAPRVGSHGGSGRNGGADASALLREVRRSWLAARRKALEQAAAEPPTKPEGGFVVRFPGHGASAAGTSASHLPATGIELVLEAPSAEGAMKGRWRYDPRRYDATTLERWSAAYLQLLEPMVAPQARPLAEWPWLRRAERHQLLVEWNDTEVAGAGSRLPHRAFEEHASRSPGDCALVVGDRSLSYGELDRWANRLAHRLQRLGVGPDVSVGICLDPCEAMLAAFLAVLKAGGTHVPLAPSYPSERLDFMVRDSAIAVLMVTPESRHRLELAASVPVVDLGDGPEDAPDERDDAPASRAVAENLGYVIYTSGSTGRPKGVALSYAVMTNLVYWQLGLTPLPPGGRSLQFNSFSFDASVLEMLAPLSSQGVLVLRGEEDRRDFGALARLLVRQCIERLIVPFTALEHLAEHLQGAPVDDFSLRWVVSTGEALQITPAVVALFRRLPGTVLFNGYGPSETHFITDYRLADADPGRWPSMPSIGRPIPNGRIYIVDPAGRPLPVGVPGEMLLGGLPVARCYLQRPRATAEKFLPDPWGEAGARMYRSGDLARWLPDGNIEFLGRMDHQVKVRGFRVELGEIEIALRGLPAVQDAAVAALPGALPGDQRLEAFVVPIPGEEVDSAVLAAGLRESLPEHMIPNLFNALERLPQTPSGKLNRRGLVDASGSPDGGSGDSGDVTLDLLASLWSRLLGRRPASAEDDFFRLGGHSLLATRLVSQVRRVFGVELPITRVFERSRLKELAQEIDGIQQAGITALEPIRPVSRSSALPLSYAQQRLWLHERLENVGWAYNIPTALALDGPLHPRALEHALQGLEARHEILRTTFAEGPEGPRQVIHRPGEVFLPVADLSGLAEAAREAELDRLLAAAARRVFDLARGPLWRPLLVRITAAEEPERSASHVLFLNFHHIIIDLWSVGILVRDVSKLYRAARDGEALALPALPLQYADFAAWQRQWLTGPVLEQQLEYWRRQLLGAPERITLPLTREEDSATAADAAGDSAGGDHWIYLPPALLQQLEGLARDSGATLFMVLLAAFQVLLYRHTGETDLVIGSDFANRNREETESMVGFFINVLPLRTDLSGSPSFKRLVERVRGATLGAHAHQDVPFDFLVRDQGAERAGSAPLFRMLFVVQNAPQEDLDLGDELTVGDRPVGTATSKFDLAIFCDRDGDGLGCRFSYRRSCYRRPGIELLAARYLDLLRRTVAEPARRIDDIDFLTDKESEEKTMDGARKESESKRRFAKFQRRRPQAVSLEETELVSTGFLSSESKLPRLIEPQMPDVDLVEWARGNQEMLDREVSEHGAILLRGFAVGSVPEFERFAAAAAHQLFGDYGDLPKEKGGEKVYKSTPYPADKRILFHNESAHMDRWPLRQFFFCVQPAEEGGETPILDCRQTYRQLDPEIRSEFEDKGLLYVRNFIEGIDVSWRDFFHTEDREVVEAKCREAGMAWEWLENGLRTEQRCPAVAKHPKTEEKVFFNQIQLHHIYCLGQEVRDSMRQLYSEHELPRNVYFGDGTAIPDEVMERVGKLYDDLSVSFPWQQGDILMVDNMLVAHARNPYRGAGRRIAVVMGDMFNQGALVH
ncbi:MAG: amino acid adenylation domain-containing protein, partial [Acidobacteriota bacterium]|nr:amino acid adenylation domain-containing protein [Acidobacteriota bacterium]